MSFTVVIPARLSSSRLPGKVLADIGGRPMVVRVAERARESGARHVYVATDHDDVAKAVEEAGFHAVMTRAEHSTGTDRLAEAVEQLGLAPDAVVVNVQGDEPLIEPGLIRAVAHAANWSFLTSRNAGTSVLHRASEIGQRGWNGQPGGG